MEKKIKKLKNLILECKRISIVTHLNPDGDAIGSSLALNHYFKSLNLISNVITPNRHPSFLDWLPGINDIIICDEDTEKSYKIIDVAKMFKSKIKYLPSRKGERYASALTDISANNTVFKKFGKINLKDYVSSFIKTKI
mgnify:CR=1 FL=1